MAKKQLNLDMPLLSVRRLPSKLSSSSSSDERKSSSNPRSSTGQSSLSNLYTPESDLTQFSKPAAVPFLWEQIPGRPKEEPYAKSECPVESWRCTPPRLPPGRIRRSGELFEERRLLKSQVSASLSYDLSALEMENESIQDIYCDALETLSQTESLSFDCRFVRSTKTSLTDSQTRDFMMRRFLPAAKAMVIDAPPQYVSQKHSLDQQNKIDEERISLIKQNQQVKDSETVEEDEDDEDEDGDDCVDAIKKPAKIRGLFAKFCLRNSLCLLNPSSGMKSKKKHVPTSSSPAPAKEVVSRMSRSSYSGPLPRLNNPLGSKLPASGNRMSFSGELLRNQSMFRGVPKIVRKTSTTTPSSFEKMYGLDHHSLSMMRSSHELEKKKKSNVCYPTDEIEEEMFGQDYNINIKDSVAVAVGNDDNGKSQNQLGSSGGKVDHDEGRKSSSKEVLQDETIMNCSPLTPPLPKSPSESWLWRAIPSISLKSPFQHHTKKQNGRLSTSSPNWETIVKTSNKHRDHVRYSEELIPRISQHSKA
ncbi:uncharacterized protein LOC124916751 [Impatiens glandulifera]|uniref:uncharacterized protein LOC124916751 n=1 Tax=Impatiens glandulifera TaxID=253017 RepID=UPI001FB0B80C|nr:uncharacterized protein LOC124916751 [Impatiens glandulifera]XP_047313465.1 uncharacterized protein LOC124916751 [Impatiens glandulifera]